MTAPVTREQSNRRIIGKFLDEQMGLPVLLVDSAYKAESSGTEGVVVPDVSGLEAAIAVARVMNDFKLNGKELKFLRRAIGLKAVDLAKFLDVSAETVSRRETGKELISTNDERVLRLRVYRTLKDRAPVVEADADIILNMTFKPVRLSNEGPMTFRYVTDIKDGRLRHVWFFEGMSEASSDTPEEKLIA
jgi:transcriptional regulator with XRE-family HTH domain